MLHTEEKGNVASRGLSGGNIGCKAKEHCDPDSDNSSNFYKSVMIFEK